MTLGLVTALWTNETGHFVPVIVVAPVASGSPVSGQIVSATTGTWANGALSYGYQWQRGSGVSWTNIAGETNATYHLAAADQGLSVRRGVTPQNTYGHGFTAYSNALGPIT